MNAAIRSGALLAASLLTVNVVLAAPVLFFDAGNPDGKMAMSSRPGSTGKAEIESADDFVLGQHGSVSGASFTGLLVGATLLNLNSVGVEIYRVFPSDSDTTRTPNVPTRVNSPSDTAFGTRDSGSAGLSFVTTALGSFTANNSIAPGGIHSLPNPTTGGNGPVSGEEVRFDLTFATPFELDADHYFFVPQVGLSAGDFYWLSAPRPIVAPGTPFAPDLQAWTRDQGLAPDWLRVGTDIVGGSPAPTYNAAFSLTGQSIPEPDTLALVELAGLALLVTRWRKTSQG